MASSLRSLMMSVAFAKRRSMPKPDPNDPIVKHRLAKKARIVPQSQRASQLPRLFGREMVLVENALYRMADRCLPKYKGAYWEMVRMDAGGFYMFPEGQRWQVFIEGNGYSGELSADATGIVVCSMLYSHLLGQSAGKLAVTLTFLFHELRSYIVGHPEEAEIHQALD
jgi:Antirestriction protein